MCNRIHLLLIEDNPSDCRLIREVLSEPEAIAVRLERTGELADGLERLAQQAYDAVLLDLHLPDSQGLETLARLRTRAPWLPCVILTDLDDEALAAAAARMGAQDYLIKTQVTAVRLSQAIRHAIEQQRAASGLARERNLSRTLIDRLRDLINVKDTLSRLVVANRSGRVSRVWPRRPN